MAKMWLMVYHPFQRPGGRVVLPQETKDRLFITSIEIIEYSRLLETEAATSRWGWLLRTYVQWQAVAIILSEHAEVGAPEGRRETTKENGLET